jgi:ABC-2 type transport system ATP-binding protein
VEDLVKRYGAQRAVDGIGFEVSRGELFGLLGPNGAGKTTTINVLSTLLPADGGRAVIGGHDVASEPAAVRRLIGVVPQEIALYQDLGARDNLLFWGRVHGLKGQDLQARVARLLDLVELGEHARQKVETFSGGMKRRLNLAAGLVHGPAVLFLDEPTVGIDAQARSRLLDLIRQLADEGLTIVYTTHYLEEAEQLCDRIGVIDRGRMVAVGDKEDLIREIGDEDRVRVAVPAPRRAELAAAATAWPGVTSVREHRGKSEIRAADGGAVLPSLQAWLAAADLELAQLEVVRPNLETLYLNLTGRGLRE